jgi:hypothetical protein
MTLAGRTDAVRTVAFHPERYMLATGSVQAGGGRAEARPYEINCLTVRRS